MNACRQENFVVANFKSKFESAVNENAKNIEFTIRLPSLHKNFLNIFISLICIDLKVFRTDSGFMLAANSNLLHSDQR